jgi:hypothetical protein
VLGERGLVSHHALEHVSAVGREVAAGIAAKLGVRCLLAACSIRRMEAALEADARHNRRLDQVVRF